MKNVRSIITIVFIIIVFGATAFGAVLEGSDIEINEYNATVTIDENGDMQIDETWDMEYSGDYNVRFRDIKYNKYPSNYPLYKKNTNIAFFDEDSVSVQVFKNGSDVTDRITVGYSFLGDRDERYQPVVCEPVSASCESIFTNFFSTGGLDGDIEFNYSYKINGAVTEYSDVSEINWTLFTYAEAMIDKGSITIVLPDTADSSDVLAFHHHIKNSSVSVNGNEITINFTKMKSKDILAFRVLFPTSYTPNVDMSNQVITDEIDKGIILDYEAEVENFFAVGYMYEEVMLYVPFIVVVVMVAIYLLLRMTLFKDPKVYDNADYYSQPPTDHSPAQIGFLLNKKVFKDEVFTATLLDLVNRGHIDIIEEDYGEVEDITFRKKEDIDFDSLRPHEKFLITWIFNDKVDTKDVSTSDIFNYANNKTYSSIFLSRYNDFVTKVEHEGNRADFYDKNISNKKFLAYIFNIIPAALFIFSIYINSVFGSNVLLGFIIPILVIPTYVYLISKIKLLNKHGQETKVKWEKYREFLKHSNNYQNAKMGDIEYYDQAMVYASLFGITDKFLENISETAKNNVLIDNRDSRVYYHTYYYYHRRSRYLDRHLRRSFGRSIRHARNNVMNARAASGYSSRSGGFGGGSFGGGGGGGRSR